MQAQLGVVGRGEGIHPGVQRFVAHAAALLLVAVFAGVEGLAGQAGEVAIRQLGAEVAHAHRRLDRLGGACRAAGSGFLGLQVLQVLLVVLCVQADAAVEPAFGGHRAHLPGLQALAVDLAAPVHVADAALAQHRGVVLRGAEDAQRPLHAAHAGAAHVGLHVFGLVAGRVLRHAFHAQGGAAGVLDGLGEQRGEGVPHLIAGGVAVDLDVVQHPHGHAAPPAHQLHGQAVVLSVDAGGDAQHAHRGCAQRVVFGAVGNGLVLHPAGGLVFPGLGQAVVDEGLELGGVTLGAQPHLHQVGPARAQADLVVQAVDVIPADAPFGVRGQPPAGGDHLGLVVLFNLRAALLAHVPGTPAMLRVPVGGPLQPAPLQVLLMVTVRAANEVAALVADEPLALNAAGALGLRAADVQALVGVGVGAGAAVQHLARVVAAGEVGGELIELVHHKPAGAGGLQARRAARVLDVELAAVEILEGAAVGGLAAGHAGEPLAHGGALVDHWLELLRHPLVEAGLTGQAHHDGPAAHAHHVAQQVDGHLGLGELNGPHQGHVTHRAHGAQAVHGLFGGRVAVSAPAARLRAALRAQDAVLVRPLAHPHRLARRQRPRGGTVHARPSQRRARHGGGGGVVQRHRLRPPVRCWPGPAWPGRARPRSWRPRCAGPAAHGCAAHYPACPQSAPPGGRAGSPACRAAGPARC